MSVIIEVHGFHYHQYDWLGAGKVCLVVWEKCDSSFQTLRFIVLRGLRHCDCRSRYEKIKMDQRPVKARMAFAISTLAVMIHSLRKFILRPKQIVQNY